MHGLAALELFVLLCEATAGLTLWTTVKFLPLSRVESQFVFYRPYIVVMIPLSYAVCLTSDRNCKKAKVTLVQTLRLCTDRTAYRGSRVIALLFHDQQH
jgi:hypothetical protein